MRKPEQSIKVSDRKWKPPLFLKGQKLEAAQEYKFLRVIIDKELRFKAHVHKIVTKCRRRNNMLRCMAGNDSGKSMETQKTLYVTYIRNVLEYASPS
jgi:hypothetical protein